MPESIVAFDEVIFCYDRAEVLHGGSADAGLRKSGRAEKAE